MKAFVLHSKMLDEDKLGIEMDVGDDFRDVSGKLYLTVGFMDFYQYLAFLKPLTCDPKIDTFFRAEIETRVLQLIKKSLKFEKS